MTDPAPIRIALAGCGRISRNHFEAIEKIDGLELAAVCDIIPERAREAGERHGVPSFESFDEMLLSVRCDAVALCTPSGLHPKHAIAAAFTLEHRQVLPDLLQRFVPLDVRSVAALACVPTRRVA